VDSARAAVVSADLEVRWASASHPEWLANEKMRCLLVGRGSPCGTAADSRGERWIEG
jgi:hypothetical protein